MMTVESSENPRRLEKPTSDEAIITLEGEDRTLHNCKIVDIIEFDGQCYGVLLKFKSEGSLATSGGDKAVDDALVIMRLIQRHDHSIFTTIESDDEFEKVLAYVEQLSIASARGGKV